MLFFLRFFLLKLFVEFFFCLLNCLRLRFWFGCVYFVKLEWVFWERIGCSVVLIEFWCFLYFMFLFRLFFECCFCVISCLILFDFEVLLFFKLFLDKVFFDWMFKLFLFVNLFVEENILLLLLDGDWLCIWSLSLEIFWLSWWIVDVIIVWLFCFIF